MSDAHRKGMWQTSLSAEASCSHGRECILKAQVSTPPAWLSELPLLWRWLEHTDLLKPGPDDGYPVLDGGDGVGVADGQDGVPHTGRFIEGSSFFLQFLHEFLQQKRRLQLAVGMAENKTPVTVIWLSECNWFIHSWEWSTNWGIKGREGTKIGNKVVSNTYFKLQL